MPISPRGAPWDPAPFNSPLGMAAWWRREGVPFGELATSLRERFPTTSAQQIGKVISQLARVETVLARFEGGLDYEKLNRVEIPRDASTPEAYRYYVDLRLRDGTGRVVDYRTVILDESTNLTLEQLKERAESMGRQLFRSPGYDRNVRPALLRNIDVSLILVTRRT